jgi:hypothetical protein
MQMSFESAWSVYGNLTPYTYVAKHTLYYGVNKSQTQWDTTFLYLSIYDSAAIVNLGRFFIFLIYTQPTGLYGRGSACRKAAT